MTINNDFFRKGADSTYDLQSVGTVDWDANDRVAERLVPTHCCFCGVQCGMNLRVAEGRVIGVEPRFFPHNQGNLCPKGIVAYQQVGHPDRLQYPLIRRGGKGSPLERASWEEALSLISGRWKALQQEHGKDSVAVYGGSSMTNEKCYLVGKFARVGLGTRHVDYNGRLCMSSAAVAYAKAFGLDRGTMPMPDIALAKCILVVGANIAECFPIATNWVWKARDNGARLIVLDPRETATARTADLWLPVRPGSDIAVTNAMLRQLIVDERIDEAYLAARANGWEAVRDSVMAYTPERAQEIAGVPAQRIVAAARIYGEADPSLILHARGLEHSSHGVNGVLSLLNMAVARGMMGRPGGGAMTLTGQGNGQGGREHGQKANQLPGYRHIDVAAEREEVAQIWGIPAQEIPQAGAAATEMVQLMATGAIKSCIVLCSNLMVSLPDVHTVERALKNLDMLVVVDFFMSETAELADVVLPCSVWCEDEGTTTNLEGRVVKINRAADPPGEARRDWHILSELAARMGRGQYFPYQSVREIWDELRLASKGGVADYSGITWERIDAEQGMFWPCPSEDHPGTPRLFVERFAHPDGKARLFAVEYQPPAEEPSADFPFRLTTGRVVYHYLSGNQTRRLGFLNDKAPDPWVEMHPQAAARLGIVDRETVRVVSPRGMIELRAMVVPTIRPDTIFIPYHYGHRDAANLLTNPSVDPTVKIPEYKACAARVEKLSAQETTGGAARENFTPENMPKMFPYAVGEAQDPPTKEGKVY